MKNCTDNDQNTENTNIIWIKSLKIIIKILLNFTKAIIWPCLFKNVLITYTKR